jgi:hypothetical protein
MRDLDDDDPTRPDWYSGPPSPRTPGPVIETYVDTETLDHDCPNCHAGQGEFCRHEAGHERKMPCPKRITTALRAIREREEAKA